MSRSAIILIAILGFACIAQAETIRGSLLTFNSKGALKSSPQAESYKFQDLVSLYKHSMGLPLNSEERASQKFVSEYKRGDIFKPAQMNYLIVMEGMKEEETDSLISRQKKIDFETSESGQKFFESVYNENEKQSVVSLLKENFVSQEELAAYYFSISSANTNYFQNYGISIIQNDEKKMQLVSIPSRTKMTESFKIENCMSKHLNNQFYYLSEKNTIVKRSTSSSLQITSENLHDVSVMIEEVCGALEFSKLFIQGERPNFVAFHFASYQNLAAKLNQDQLSFIKDLWKTALNLMIVNLEKGFTDSVLGAILFTEGQQFQNFISESGNFEYIPHNIQFSQTKSTQINQRRNLEVEPTKPVRLPNYQIRVWFSIAFIVIIYFTLYALVTAKSDRDSLLYAKFLTNDIKN